MHIRVSLRWLCGTGQVEEIDPALLRLLEAVRAEGSLARAAIVAGVSYRHSWGLVRKWENRLQARLLHMQRGRGRGARLSDPAERLLQSCADLQQQLGPALDQAGERLSAELLQLTRAGATRTLRIAASHDLGIQVLVEQLRRASKLDIQLQTRGSLESLRLLARSECAVAGFHLPLGPLRNELWPAYARWLRDERCLLLRVAVRQQGLMTQRANPKRINTLADLTRRSVRFVNRQPESGTRATIDRLLLLNELDPDRIRGYRSEEFTHTAVAAMVAGGAADAAFGIAAAAAEFQLRFVPIIEEEYFLAVPGDSAEPAARLRRTLRSTEFRRQLGRVPGYDVRSSGSECRPIELAAPA